MYTMKVLLCCVAFVLISVNCTTVEVGNGKLLGSYNGRYYSFVNVPYAQPPTGENRFEPPLAYTDKWTDVRNATLPGVACVLFSKFVLPTDGIEDCLVVNVYTPDISCKRQYPVHVHIHGGVFMNGAARNLNESYIASEEIVLVMPNYRLGPLGFLSSGDELISGNFGLKDQQMALQWVQENIHAFCGDAKNVVVSGFSAGGASVHLHMLNSVSSQLFSAAISISGVAVNPWAMQPNPEEQFSKFAAALDCELADRESVKLCLKSRTSEQIFDATNAMKVYNNNPINLFGVVVEPEQVSNAFLTQHPRVLIRSGQISDIPWIVSHTSREGGFTAADFMSYDESGRELIYTLNTRWRELAPIVLFYNNSYDGQNEEQAAKFRDIYSDSLRNSYMQEQNFSVETYPLLEQIFTDVMFVNGVEEMVDLHRRYGKAPVYTYDFRNPTGFSIGNRLSNRSDLDFGASHGADMANVLPVKFLEQPNATNPNPPYSECIGKNLVRMGIELSTSGMAVFNNKKLPVNNATHTGKMTIFDTYFTLDSCVEDGSCENNVYNYTGCN